MGTAAIAYDDLLTLPGVGITATNAVPERPAADLISTFLSQPFRAVGLSTVIDVDLGAARDVGIVFFGRLRQGATGFASIAISASNVGQGGAEILNDDVTSAAQFGYDALYRQAAYVLPSSVTARYWRISLTQTGGDFFEAGRLFLSPVLPLTVSITYPVLLSRENRNTVLEGLDAERTIYRRRPVREISFGYRPGALIENDAMELLSRTLDEVAGFGRGVVLLPDRVAGASHLDIRQAVYGYLTEIGSAGVEQFGAYSKDYRIREAG